MCISKGYGATHYKDKFMFMVSFPINDAFFQTIVYLILVYVKVRLNRTRNIEFKQKYTPARIFLLNYISVHNNAR